MTTEERIAQIANNFASGIQNYQQQTDRFRQIEQQDRAAQLAQEARKRQEAIQAIEAANALSRTTGRVIDPAALQPILAGGDLSGFGQLMQSGPETQDVILARQKLAQEDARYNAQMKRQSAQDQRQAMLDQLNMENTRSQIDTRNIAATKTKATAGKIEKLGVEGRNKVGSIASGIQALDAVDKSITAGYKPEYLTSSTPLLGQFISDNPLTESQRVVSEVVGRLQSGGAINKEEEARFNAMGPRPGDNFQTQKRKIKQQKDFLKNKLTAYGLSEADLANEGFALTSPEIRGQEDNGVMMSDAVANDAALNKVKSMSRDAILKDLRKP